MSLTNYLSRFLATSNPTPAESLALSQQGPKILNLGVVDKPEQWALYESLLISTLTTGDDQAARLIIQRLTDRFGSQNSRIMALRGLFDEATAENDKELEEVLKGYEVILKDDPTNMPIAKRRVTLLSHLDRPQEAITALTFLLSIIPTDAESWTQLAELYFELSLFQQAIFCLEEVLLILPNAYNIHARLGEITCVSAETSQGQDCVRLETSMKWFCRSIELCDGYLRGLYGLKLVTSKLLNSQYFKQTNPTPSTSEDKVSKLNTQATTRLQEIVLGHGAGKKAYSGYNHAEVEAARELIAKADIVVG